jgi:hypothetical protein
MIRLCIFGLAWTTIACTAIGSPMPRDAEGSKASDAGCPAATRGCERASQDSEPQKQVDAKPEADAGATKRSASDRGSSGVAAHGGSTSTGRDAAAADGGISGQAGSGESMSSPGKRAPDAQTGAAGAGADASAHAQDKPGDDTLTPPDGEECEYVEVRARSDGAESPYQVPTGDGAGCFLFDAGFDAETQAFGFSPLIDNPSVVSYIVLRTLERSDSRGPLVACDGAFPTHQMVAAWAPGASDWYYPKDMGVDLGRGLFLLEVHYFNSGGGPTQDRSGIRVCTSKQLRPRTASMSWLGNQAFSIPAGAKDYAVTGRCTPARQTEPIHILRVLPFMNALGKRATMQIDHIDGSTQSLLDAPFISRERKTYDTAAVVRIGDSVLSTCYYDNSSSSGVSIGTGHNEELCHFIVLAYPAHALVNDGFSIENNSCLGTP